METTELIQEVSKLLAPVLPLLAAGGGAAAKKMMEKAGEATWGKISSCWEAISRNAEDKPQEKAALQNAIAQNDLGQRTASLESILAKLLATDRTLGPQLAKYITNIQRADHFHIGDNYGERRDPLE